MRTIDFINKKYDAPKIKISQSRFKTYVENASRTFIAKLHDQF